MMYVLVWMQLFSTQTVEHYQLGNYAAIEECQIQLSKAAKMVTHKSDPNTPNTCLLYTSPSPRDGLLSRMPSSA